MLKLLEAIRQENKREREEIKSRLARIEAMVGQVIESGAASGLATPTNRREKKTICVYDFQPNSIFTSKNGSEFSYAIVKFCNRFTL